MILDKFDISHWAFLISGLGFGITVVVVLAVLVYHLSSVERANLDERLCMIEAWLKQIVAFQDLLAKKDVPKKKKPWNWGTVGTKGIDNG